MNEMKQQGEEEGGICRKKWVLPLASKQWHRGRKQKDIWQTVGTLLVLHAATSVWFFQVNYGLAGLSCNLKSSVNHLLLMYMFPPKHILISLCAMTCNQMISPNFPKYIVWHCKFGLKQGTDRDKDSFNVKVMYT